MVPAEPSSDPARYQWNLNPESGQVIIQLPKQDLSAVKQLNCSLLQTAAAGALSIELTRRLTRFATDADFQDFSVTGVRVCGEILEEHNQKVRQKTGEGLTLNLLTKAPEITGYSPAAVFGTPGRPEETS